MRTAASIRFPLRFRSVLRPHGVDHAEVRDDGGRSLGLDSGKRRARVAAQHELAIDEQRVRRAIDEELVAGGLEHHPRGSDGPAQQLTRAKLFRDVHAREADAGARPAAVDRDRASVFDADDAHHGRLGRHRQEKCDGEDDGFHCVVWVRRSGARREAGVERAE